MKCHLLTIDLFRSKKLEEYITTLENNVKLKNDDISHLENEILNLKSQKAQVTAEMTAVNQVSVSEQFDGFLEVEWISSIRWTRARVT